MINCDSSEEEEKKQTKLGEKMLEPIYAKIDEMSAQIRIQEKELETMHQIQKQLSLISVSSPYERSASFVNNQTPSQV